MKRAILLVFATAAILRAATGAAFLRIPVDARVCGTGEAAAATARGAAALFYNPAALGRLTSFGAAVMHNQWFLDMKQEYAAAAYGTPELGTFGAAFDYWTSGEMQGINWRGETIPGYTFSAADWSLAVGYGRSAGTVDFGVGAKFVHQRNESLAVSAWAVDFGALYGTPLPGLSVGASATNLGPDYALDQDAMSLPWTIRAGWRYDWRILSVTQDFVVSADEKPGIAVGAECRPVDIVALRLGYRTGSDIPGFAHLRAGLGVSYRGFGVDYAFAPYGELGMTHRLSLSYGVAAPSEEPEE